MKKSVLLIFVVLFSLFMCSSCRRETESEKAQRRIRDAISSYNEAIDDLERTKKEQERVQHLIDQYENRN